MTEAQEPKVYAALERVFRQCISTAGPRSKDRRTHDFVFHMTDWYNDLVELARVMEHPEGKTNREWTDAVYGFLIHVSGHLAAATRIAEFEPVEFEMPPGVKPLKRGKKALASR